jgi:ribosomal protein L24E
MASSLQESPPECNVGWLLFVLRANRRRESLRIAGGRDLHDDEPLRQSIRERLADGRLPIASGVSTVRQGTGRPCNVCGKAITPGTPEHEVEGRGDTYALAHPDCYKLWREESRKRSQPPNPPAR